MFYFLTAVQFLTRFPVKRDLNPGPEDLAKSSLYFPVVGILLGIVLWFVAKCLGTFIDSNLVVSAAMISLSMLMTGAFHEDGLADTFDGIGGAFDPKSKLSIMKDSRIGTYGASALMLYILLKASLYAELLDMGLFLPLILSLSYGRYTSLVMIRALGYVSDDHSSKSKPVASALEKSPFLKATLIQLATAAVCLPIEWLFPVLLLCILKLYGLKIFFEKQIGGITGDVLGAVNVISELAILILFTVISSL